MKVLSFLGTGNYSPTLYAWDDRVCTTSFFPVAACAFFEPEELLLATTTGARAKWWTEVRTELAQRYPHVTLTEVSISDGSNEEEIWRIFDALVDRFSPGDKLIIDITHGFRSLPVLAIIAAVYLRVAKNVTVQALVYGAYEARGSDGRTPVFDLTPFLTLLEWSAGADLFRHSGNAEPLAALLSATQDRLYRASERTPDLPRLLKNTGRALAGLSEATRLVRVHEVMERAGAIRGSLQAVEVEARRWAPPFAVLLEQLRQEYAPFVPEDDGTEADLAVQLELIRWYAGRGWGAEAVLLAREWVVSLEAWRSGLDVLGKRERETVESRLYQEVEAKRQDSRPAAATPAGADPRTPLAGSVSVWSWVVELRNDIAHVGMRHGTRRAGAIGQEVAGLFDRLLPLLEEALKDRQGAK